MLSLLALAVLLSLQLALGVGSLAIVTTAFQRSTAAPPLHLATVTAHLAVGAGLLAASLVLAMRARRTYGARAAFAAPVPTVARRPVAPTGPDATRSSP